MKIKALLDGIEFEWLTHERVERIKNVTHKASEIKEEDCYICLHTNKENMIQMEKAIQNGATLVITDKYILTGEKVAVIRVKDIRESYALIAKNYYMKACDSMKMIAVVGTNGKSTTSYLIWSLLTKNNIMCGLIGTGFYMIGKKRFKMDMTTPDPMELHMILSVMANCGTQIVVMEVSSHAIFYKKTSGIKYNIGVFTNLSQDHLDFFGSMDNLEEVKHSFFLNGNAQISLINIDDNSGSKLETMLSLPNITLGFDSNADIIITKSELTVNGSKFNVNLFNEDTTFESKLVGRYNIYNILSAVLVCKLLGVRIKGLINSLREIEPLDGRANIIVHNDINFVIDYAHSPDGLQNILTEFRNITAGEIIIVFGAGGDRDKDKRHKMGAIAKEFADKVIITTDNPRNEEPLRIMEDIASGIDNKENVYLIENRVEAIRKSISLAESGDTIIIAGKGAEEYFEKNGKKYPYSDKNTLEELLGIKWK